MATCSVVVHDIECLNEFCNFLSAKRDDIARLYDALTNECLAQEENWHDPQYEKLRENIDSFADASKAQLAMLDESISYITRLVAKLKDV